MSDRFGNIPIQPPESSPSDQKPTPKHSDSAVRPSQPPRPSKPQLRKKSPNQARPFNKIWVLVIGLVSTVVCYGALGFFGIPYYCTKFLPEIFHKKTAMFLMPTTVAFNPFTFRLTSGKVRILDESGGQIVSLDALRAEIAPLAVLHRDMACKRLTLNGLDLSIVREMDGSYNFQPLLGVTQNRKISEIIKKAELPFFFSLNNNSISDSRATFNDKPAGKVHTAEKIKLDLPTFANTSFTTEQYLHPHFSAVINGSPLELTGQANLDQAGQAQTTRLTVNVHDLELPTYAGYLPFNLAMECTKGKAHGKIDLLFDPHTSTGEKLSISFQLQVVEAELVGESSSINISAPSARVSGSLQPISKTLHLYEVAVKEPSVNFHGGSLLDNIGQLGQKNRQAASAGATIENAVPYLLLLDLLLVDNGVVRFFSDSSAQQPASAWNTIQASIKNYRSDAEVTPNDNNGPSNISGEKEGTPTSFSWHGKFTSPNSLTGSLHLRKMDSKDLLKAIGGNHPFAMPDIQGVTDLKGQLTFYTEKGSPNRIHYKLADTEISIDDFDLLDNEQSILRAPVVKLAGFNLSDKTIDFGNILVKKGTAQFTYGQLPKIYREFTTDNYQLQGLDFEGRLFFSPAKNADQSLAFSEVSIKANELTNGQHPSDNLSISAKTATGGIFQVQGNVALTPFSATLKTGFRDLPVQDIRPLLTSSAKFAELQGILSGKGLWSLPTKNFAGELELSDVSGKGPHNSPFSWQKSVFRDVNYTAKPLHFASASVAIDGSRFSWQINRESNSPMHYFSDFIQAYFPAADRQDAPKTKNSTAPVDIEEISFTAGTVDIHDHRLNPDWLASGVEFNGSINNIHAAATTASRFSFTGQMADSPFSIDGTMAPFAQEENGAFQFSLKTFPLASFAEQYGAKSKIDTTSGQLTLALDCAWQDRQYLNSGQVVFTNLKPVEASSEIALPLALLTDTSGTIQLPINFTRTAPIGQTALVEEIVTSIQRLLLKGSVSPLLLASGDFTDLIGNESIEFRPGEFIITETGQNAVNRYAALLLAHPHVGLVLSGGVDKEIDGRAMKQNLTVVEQQRVDRENEKLFKKWQDQKAQYQKNLEERSRKTDPNEKIVEQDIPQAILSQFQPLSPLPVEVDEAMLLELAQKRIDYLSQSLITQNTVQPERISSVLPGSLANQPQGSSTGVAITLTALTP